MSGVRVLTSAAELVDATGAPPGRRPRRRRRLRRPRRTPWAHPADGAVAFHRRSDHGVPGSAALGTASGLAALLDDPARARLGHRWRQPAPQRAARPDAGGRAAARPRQPRAASGTGCGPAPLPRWCPARSTSSVLDPSSARRGRGLPRRAQPAHPRAAVRPPGPALGRGARPAHRSARRRRRQRAERGGHPHAGRHRRRPPTGAARAGARRSPPTSPGWPSTETGACALGHVRRQRRRPAALPPAGLHDRDGVDLRWFERLTCA